MEPQRKPSNMSKLLHFVKPEGLPPQREAPAGTGPSSVVRQVRVGTTADALGPTPLHADRARVFLHRFARHFVST